MALLVPPRVERPRVPPVLPVRDVREHLPIRAVLPLGVDIEPLVPRELVDHRHPPERVLEHRFEPGGVAPFPHRAVTRTFVDRLLFQHATVWIGAGTSSHMASLAPGDLLRLTRGEAADLVAPR